MRVHVAHAQSEQMFLLDESQDLVIVRHDNPIQLLQKPQHDGARLQIADRQFADNEGMCRNLFSNEQISQYVIVPAQMVQSTPRCPPVSRNLRSATAHRLQMRLRTAQPGQPACGFTLNQGLKRRTHQSGLFTDPRELLRVGNQIIVEYDCRPHRLPRRRTASFKASLDVNYNAWQSAIALCRAVFVSGWPCTASFNPNHSGGPPQ
jgi:hypothetical protein